MDPREEIAQLTRELERHNHLYYVLDNPEIPDYEYDRMLRRLETLEEQRAALPGQYGLEGWSEDEVAETAKSFSYIDRAMEQERQERKKQAADRTAFRRLFSGMALQEQEAICKEDMIRQEYTEEARQGLLAAWKEHFFPSRFDKAVQETDRSLGLTPRETHTKKHTLSQ